MKTRIARYLIAVVAVGGLATIPAVAGDLGSDRWDLRQDYRNVERQNSDIRHDRIERDRALAYGEYGRAARIQRDINHDRAARNAQLRDVRRDRADLYRDGYAH